LLTGRQTDKQTDKRHYITSRAEVITDDTEHNDDERCVPG